MSNFVIGSETGSIYRISPQKLAAGSFGVIYKCHKSGDSSSNLIVKILSSEMSEIEIEQEIDIMKLL